MTDPENGKRAELKISRKFGALGELAQIAFEAVGASLSRHLKPTEAPQAEINVLTPDMTELRTVLGDEVAGGLAHHPTLAPQIVDAERARFPEQ